MNRPMKRIGLPIVLIAVAAVLAAGFIVAGPHAMAQRESRPKPSRADSLRILNEQLANAKLKLVDAIKHTEKHTDGVVLLAMYSPVDDGLHVELKVLIGQKVTAFTFDAMTGKRINREKDDDDDDGEVGGDRDEDEDEGRDDDKNEGDDDDD